MKQKQAKKMTYKEDAKDFAQSFHVSVELDSFLLLLYLNFPFSRFLVVSCRCRVFAHRAEYHETLLLRHLVTALCVLATIDVFFPPLHSFLTGDE